MENLGSFVKVWAVRTSFIPLLLSLSLVTRAAEEPETFNYGDFYLSLGGGGVFINGPEMNAFSSAVSDGFMVFIRDPDSGLSINELSSTIGLKAGVDLYGFRFEVDGTHSTVETDLRLSDTLSVAGGGEGFVYLDIEGQLIPDLIALPGGTVTTAVDAQITLSEGKISAQRELPYFTTSIVGNVIPTVAFGAVAGHISQEYTIRHNNVDFPEFHRLDETLNSYYVGPFGGLSLTTHPTKNIAVIFSVEAAGLFHHANLVADQTALGLAFGPFTGRVEDDQNEFGARAGLGLDIEFDVGLGKLTLGASATYWTYVPQISNPSGNVPGSALSPALTGRTEIDGGDMITSQIMLRLKIPLGETPTGRTVASRPAKQVSPDSENSERPQRR